MFTAFSARSALVSLVLLSATACEPQTADLREWKASDHDHTSDPGRDQVDVSNPAANPLAAHGVSEVVLLAWRQNCVRCHGLVGRGDGQQASMFQPPDLTNPERQSQLGDADILNVIKQGRGKMPGFNLPDSTLTGLLKLVRLLDSSGKGLRDSQANAPASASAAADAATAGSASGAPAASVAPSVGAPRQGPPGDSATGGSPKISPTLAPTRAAASAE